MGERDPYQGGTVCVWDGPGVWWGPVCREHQVWGNWVWGWTHILGGDQ